MVYELHEFRQTNFAKRLACGAASIARLITCRNNVSCGALPELTDFLVNSLTSVDRRGPCVSMATKASRSPPEKQLSLSIIKTTDGRSPDGLAKRGNQNIYKYKALLLCAARLARVRGRPIAQANPN
jgi:hypothetical protein